MISFHTSRSYLHTKNIFVLGSLFIMSVAFAPPPIPNATTPATTTAAPVNEWPQTITSNGSTYTLNEPSYGGITGNTVTLKSVLQVKPTSGAPSTGTATITANMAPADVNGLVELNNFAVIGVDGMDGTTVTTSLTGLLANMAFTVPLATVVQDITLDQTRSDKGLSNQVPTIIVTEKPTVLVSVAGQPMLSPVASTGWQKVSNTPFILLQNTSGAWFVRLGANTWMTSQSLSGPFIQSASAVPQQVVDALGQVPPPPTAVGKDTHQTVKANTTPPNVIVATAPTVLVSINGPIKTAAAGRGIWIVTNTQQNLLISARSPTCWVLASGRWFNCPTLNGPWVCVLGKDLPPEFKTLKPDGGKISAMMASVPGTNEATEAVVNSGLVRTVVLDRSNAKCAIQFAGAPVFAPIEGTNMRYATNANQPVIQLENTLYCCDSAAWFSATDPLGPWTLCAQVPEAIYSIPPSCAIYACTFVQVYASDANSVTFGFTSGYLGTYIQDGGAVYGTGYNYASTSANNGSVQTYPQTYGSANTYDQDTGTYAPPSSYDTNDYSYYGYYPAVEPKIYGGYYGGWGWYGGYDSAYAYGYGNYGAYNNWGRYYDNWHPNNYWNNGANGLNNVGRNNFNRWNNSNNRVNGAGFDNGDLSRANMWGADNNGVNRNGWNRGVNEVNGVGRGNIGPGFNNNFADRGEWNQSGQRPMNNRASGFHQANQNFNRGGEGNMNRSSGGESRGGGGGGGGGGGRR